MNEEDAFQAALDADPADHTVRLVFADWLQERDDPRAEGYRMIGRLGVTPFHTRAGSDTAGAHWGESWSWSIADLVRLGTGNRHWPVSSQQKFASRRELEDETAAAVLRLRRVDLLALRAMADGAIPPVG